MCLKNLFCKRRVKRLSLLLFSSRGCLLPLQSKGQNLMAREIKRELWDWRKSILLQSWSTPSQDAKGDDGESDQGTGNGTWRCLLYSVISFTAAFGFSAGKHFLKIFPHYILKSHTVVTKAGCCIFKLSLCKWHFRALWLPSSLLSPCWAAPSEQAARSAPDLLLRSF